MTGLDVERRTLRKVTWRLLPLVAVAYFVASLDRTNISYAALTMNRDLQLSPKMFGWGAGIFGLTYLLLEVPSNLMLERVGARLWIARIMITWGLISAATAWATGPASFVGLRLLLGAAEAGFVPGILLYLTHWFPRALRGRAVAVFLLAAPLSNAVSGLVSTPILGLDGWWGLRGWQWIFVIEGLPAVLLGVLVVVYLTDRPAGARWLRDDERTWLEREIAQERPVVAEAGAGLWRTFGNPYVLALGAVYALRNVGMFGIAFFLPQIIQALGLPVTQVGLVAAVPYAAATVGMWLWARSSDRRNERRLHLTASMLAAGLGLGAVALLGASPWSLLAVSVAATGFFACSPCLFPIAPQVLAPADAAGGLAIINSIGQIGAIAGPYGVGWIRTETGSFEGALYFMAGAALLSAVVAFCIRPGRGGAEVVAA